MKEELQQKLNKLRKHKITLIQWQDEWKHWRLGLDWKSEDDYLFIVEKPTVEECIDAAIDFLSTHNKE